MKVTRKDAMSQTDLVLLACREVTATVGGRWWLLPRHQADLQSLAGSGTALSASAGSECGLEHPATHTE